MSSFEEQFPELNCAYFIDRNEKIHNIPESYLLKFCLSKSKVKEVIDQLESLLMSVEGEARLDKDTVMDARNYIRQLIILKKKQLGLEEEGK